MAKSSWKFQYMCSHLYKCIFINSFKTKKLVKLFCRSSTVPKFFLKKSVYLYKGSIFTKILFSKYTLGYKIGEFNITKKPFNFPQKNIKNKR